MVRKSSAVSAKLRPILGQAKAKLLPKLKALSPAIKAMFQRPAIGRNRPKPGQSITILTEAGDKRNYWQASDAGMMQLDDPLAGSVILTFSDQDACLPVSKKLSHRQINTLARSELGPNLRLVNDQKGVGMVFGTGAERVGEHALPMVSGLLLLTHLLKHHKLWPQKDAGPRVVGFAFGNDQDRLLVLYLYDGGTLSLLQVTPRTPETRSAIENYIKTVNKERPGLSSKGLRADDPDRIVLFEASEIQAILQTLRPYPTEGNWYGVPQSMVLHYARLAALGTLMLSMGYAGTQYVRLQASVFEKSSLEARAQSAKESLAQMIRQSPSGFIALGSVTPIDLSLAKARAVYRAPGRVVLVSSLDQISLSSILDIPAGVSWGMSAGIAEQLSAVAPDQCSRQTVDTNTSISQLTVSYVCTQPNSDLAGLFSAGR